MRSSIILFPSKECWLTTGAGKSGLGYVYVILMDSAMRARHCAQKTTSYNWSFISHVSWIQPT